MTKTDKRDRADRFRDRLAQAMETADMSRAELARHVGVDRSTVSQILAKGGTRLPNAQVVGECAAALGVSSDWLLGLSDRPEQATELLAASLLMTEAPRALADEQIIAWHREAEGYKIRHVPATLPDMLKTNAMLDWEYAPHLGRTTRQAIASSADHLAWMRAGNSDYEIALPVFELESMARAEGYYRGLPLDVRREQLDRLEHLHTQLYPSLRLFLYDARRLYSAPVTIFGPLLAVIYLGRNYISFRDRERVRAITFHFDWLIREADGSARGLPERLDALRAEMDTG